MRFHINPGDKNTGLSRLNILSLSIGYDLDTFAQRTNILLFSLLLSFHFKRHHQEIQKHKPHNHGR